MTSLLASAVAFTGIHVGVSGSSLRSRIVGALGPRAYMVLFSTASLVTIIWLVMAYQGAGYRPLWGPLEWWKPIQIVLMLPAFLLVVIGLTSPNPTAVGQDQKAAAPPQGIVRITRHPFLTGVAIWAGVHVIGTGDVASLLFFGALFITAAAGAVSIDAKRRRTLGAAVWDRFAAQTSIVPFAAVLSHRNTLRLAELGVWRPVAGLAAYALMLGGHSHTIGVLPFPN